MASNPYKYIQLSNYENNDIIIQVVRKVQKRLRLQIIVYRIKSVVKTEIHRSYLEISNLSRQSYM